MKIKGLETVRYRAEWLGQLTDIEDVQLRYYKDCFSKARLDKMAKRELRERFGSSLTYLTINLPTLEGLSIDYNDCTFNYLLRSINHEYLCFILYFLQSKNAAIGYDKLYLTSKRFRQGFY